MGWIFDDDRRDGMVWYGIVFFKLVSAAKVLYIYAALSGERRDKAEMGRGDGGRMERDGMG